MPEPTYTIPQVQEAMTRLARDAWREGATHAVHAVASGLAQLPEDSTMHDVRRALGSMLAMFESIDNVGMQFPSPFSPDGVRVVTPDAG